MNKQWETQLQQKKKTINNLYEKKQNYTKMKLQRIYSDQLKKQEEDKEVLNKEVNLHLNDIKNIQKKLQTEAEQKGKMTGHLIRIKNTKNQQKQLF